MIKRVVVLQCVVAFAASMSNPYKALDHQHCPEAFVTLTRGVVPGVTAEKARRPGSATLLTMKKRKRQREQPKELPVADIPRGAARPRLIVFDLGTRYLSITFSQQDTLLPLYGNTSQSHSTGPHTPCPTSPIVCIVRQYAVDTGIVPTATRAKGRPGHMAF